MKETPFFLSCRESARLLTVQRDRALDPKEKMALFFHLPICKACRRFNRQMHFLNEAMSRWRTTLKE